MTATISSIYRRGQRAEPTPHDEAAFAEGCRRAWHEKAIIVVRREDMPELPALVRMALEAFAVGRWGRRAGGGS